MSDTSEPIHVEHPVDGRPMCAPRCDEDTPTLADPDDANCAECLALVQPAFLETPPGENAVMAELVDLMADKNATLHPDLVPYMEESGPLNLPMLRHPLVYSIPFTLPGLVNRQYEYKREALAEAIEKEDWHSVVFLHERAYRLRALIDYVTGRNEDGVPLSLAYCGPATRDLACDVWVDSENIQQNIDDWRALFDNGEVPFLGTPEEQAAFDALPRRTVHGTECIKAYRGGSVGDWSWTTDREIAEFFARRSGLHVRGYQIPVADVFGYLIRRHESELLVRFTEFRRPLVYPNGEEAKV